MRTIESSRSKDESISINSCGVSVVVNVFPFPFNFSVKNNCGNIFLFQSNHDKDKLLLLRVLRNFLMFINNILTWLIYTYG